MDRRQVLGSDALRSFDVFARHRNFTSAAKELHLSQPSLHVKIRKLADALGDPLYERSGRTLVLTPVGADLAEFAAASRRGVDDFLAGLGGDVDLPLRIAAGRGAYLWVIGEAVQQLSADGRRLHLEVADRLRTVQAVRSGTADIGVIAHGDPPDDLEEREIGAYDQVLVVRHDHPLAGRTRLTAHSLDGLDLVVPPVPRDHRLELERVLSAADVRWQPVIEADGWDLMVRFVELGMASAVVNGCVRVPDGLRAIPISDLPVVRYHAIWRRARGAVVQPLVAALRDR